MTAAVSMPISLPQLPDATAEARKRRREILVSQRTTILDMTTAVSVNTVIADPLTKRRKVEAAPATKVAAAAAAKPAKKPQMKYDPDVPMSKEEAAAWRREQRRKRNRESAAASRQRQRDRITELEGEVGDWKLKVEAILDRIKKLEDATGKKAPAEVLRLPTQTRAALPLPALRVPALKYVSPPSSPRTSSPVEAPMASPVVSANVVVAAQVTPKEDMTAQSSVETEQELSDNMISRQAAS